MPVRVGSARSWIIFERSLIVSRRNWTTLLSGFFEPLFYLLAFGVGLSSLVGAISVGDSNLTYLEFIAPGLLAVSAMNGAVFDSTYNVFFKMKFQKLYDVMMATSLRPMDIALGEITWSLARGSIYGLAFLLVMLIMGLISSWWALLALPALSLIGFGFAAVGMALSTFIKTFQQLDWVQVAILPMMLFSTTFFPLAVYPPSVQPLVECLPLYQAIELMRGLTTGELGSGLVFHALYFVVLSAVGALITSRRLDRLLRN